MKVIPDWNLHSRKKNKGISTNKLNISTTIHYQHQWLIQKLKFILLQSTLTTASQSCGINWLIVASIQSLIPTLQITKLSLSIGGSKKKIKIVLPQSTYPQSTLSTKSFYHRSPMEEYKTIIACISLSLAASSSTR